MRWAETAARALLVPAVIGLSLAATTLSAAARDASAGDVWIATVGQPAGAGHEHDPHLPCADLSLWGAKLADAGGSFTIESWPPSGGRQQVYASTMSSSQSHSPGSRPPQIIATVPAEVLIGNAVAAGAHATAQGFHFKLQLSQDPQKHLTFWLRCPQPAPPPPSGGGGGTSGGGTSGGGGSSGGGGTTSGGGTSGGGTSGGGGSSGGGGTTSGGGTSGGGTSGGGGISGGGGASSGGGSSSSGGSSVGTGNPGTGGTAGPGHSGGPGQPSSGSSTVSAGSGSAPRTLAQTGRPRQEQPGPALPGLPLVVLILLVLGRPRRIRSTRAHAAAA